MLARTGCPLAACCTLLLVLHLAPLLAAEKVSWLTGPALRKKLQQRESVAWSGQALREALTGFSRTQRVAVLLDRRVDPGQPMEISLADTPLAEMLAAVAGDRGLGVSYVDSVIYLGPPTTTHRLRTIIEMRKDELSRWPHTARLAWLQAHPWQWADFATPRELLRELSRAGKFEIKNLELVPHDLWAAADLPPLGLVERLSLILAQFDYTWRFEPGGAAITFEPMPAEVGLERTYAFGNKGQELAQKLVAALPGATARWVEGQVLVRATIEQHEQIASGVIKTTKTLPPGDDSLEHKTFTLTATNQPVKAILDSLKRQLKLELQIDAAKLTQAGISLDKLVSVKVKDATLDETLTATLTPAGLTFLRKGKKLEITVGEAP